MSISHDTPGLQAAATDTAGRYGASLVAATERFDLTEQGAMNGPNEPVHVEYDVAALDGSTGITIEDPKRPLTVDEARAAAADLLLAADLFQLGVTA